MLTRAELIACCKETGLTGRSGNGFLVATKLEALTKENTTLIINAVECDPGLVTDSWLYKNRISEIKKGTKIIKNAMKINSVILATKEPLKQMDGIKSWKMKR